MCLNCIIVIIIIITKYSKIIKLNANYFKICNIKTYKTIEHKDIEA